MASVCGSSMFALLLTASTAISLTRRTSPPPPFVYMLGVEGSNHHGVMAELLYPLVTERCNQGPCNMQKIRELPSSVSDKLPSNPWCPSVQRDPEFRKAFFSLNMTGVTDSFLQHPNHWFLEDMSFPGDHMHRDVPMPIDLGIMFRAIAPLTNFKFLVLQRSFESLVVSRQDFDSGPRPHAEKMAEFLTYLSGELQLVPLTYWKVLPVDCLEWNEQTRMMAKVKVAEFLGINSQCCGCFNSWRSPTSHERIEDVEVIMESTVAAWPVFDASEDGPYVSQYLLNPSTCEPQ